MKRAMQKNTEQKYLSVFNQIFHAVRMNPKVTLRDICTSNNVAHNIPFEMQKIGILQKTSYGLKWIDVPPNTTQVHRLLEYRSQRAMQLKNNNQVDLFTSIKNEQTTEHIKRKRKPVISHENKQKDIVLTNNNSFELKLFGLSIIKIAR